MDAKTLYRQGVVAIRDEKDAAKGRDLLQESLKLDPNNDMAWLWLTRTVRDPQTRLSYVQRALQINPANEQARQLRDRLVDAAPPADASPAPPAAPAVAPRMPSSPIRPLAPKTVSTALSPDDELRVAQWLERGQIYQESGDTEAAIEQWVQVLKVQVDHELALRNAVGTLWRLRYWDDARELVQRAIDAGTTVPSVYLTAIDLADRQGNHTWAEEIRTRVASSPQTDDQLIVKMAEYDIQRFHTDQALQFLNQALEAHPTSQPILIKTGELLDQLHRKQEAMAYYDQAVRLGSRTKAGKEADKRLSTFVPVLTDRERGNLWLAVRETAAFGAFMLLLAWQDAGLDMLALGPKRWAGVLLGLAGGYLLVTATSSPQQQPVAAWLGGEVPPPEPQKPGGPPQLPGRAMQDPTSLPIVPLNARYLLGIAGVMLLIIAFWLVFHTSIDAVSNHAPPYLPWSE